MARSGSAYLLTWGRRHSEEALAQLASVLDVDMFVLGHQSQEMGWVQAGKNVIILASDHNHGCFVAFDLAKSYTIEELVDRIVPLASVV